MKTLKQSFQLIKYNISSIFLFEILYKLLSTALLTPVLYALFMLSLKFADIDYINYRNIYRYFASPFTYVVIFLILLILSAYALMHMSGLIYAYDLSYKKKRANALLIFIKAFLNAFRVLRPQNMMFGIYVLLILPFTYTIMISASLAGIRIPEYMSNYIFRNKILLVTVILAYGILSVFSMIRIFSLNYFTLYRQNYKHSMADSKSLIKKRAVYIILGTVALNAVISVLLFGLEWLVVSGTAAVLKNILPYKSFGFVIHTVIQVSFLILYVIFSIISTPVISAFICSNFYQLKDKQGEINGEEAHGDEDEKEIIGKRKNYLITIFAVMLGIFLNGLYLYLDFNNRYKLNILYSSLPEITAHRGASSQAPENTMAAVRLAVENQADIVEIDIRQTKDGKFILMHDENLKRTTGYDAKVGDMDYADIEKLDASMHFDDEYAGEKIPTLDELLEYAAMEDVFLNIELKPSKTDKDYASGVISLIEQYERISRCVVASSSYELLKEVKHINPDIKTVYIMTMAIGELGDMEYADVYSVRYNFLTASMVRNAHRHGKEVYAWTINSEETIRDIMALDVDSIITDKPYATKKIVYDEDENFMTGLLKKLLREY